MKITNYLRLGFTTFLLLSVLSGCATVIPVERGIGTLNLKNEQWPKLKPDKKVIAIVSPSFANTQKQRQLPPSITQNPFLQKS